MKREEKVRKLLSKLEANYIMSKQLHDEKKYVAMDSPLGPFLANIFLPFHGKTWFNHYSIAAMLMIALLYSNPKPYVLPFLSISQFQTLACTNIKFTLELESNSSLPILALT